MPTINISMPDNVIMDISVSERLDIEAKSPITTVDVYVHPEPSANDGARVVARDGEVDSPAVPLDQETNHD